MNERDDRPWYRYLWPWLLMIPPAGAVVGGMLTAWLAGGPPALVVDDYAEIGLATERRLARDRRAAQLGLAASLRLSEADAGRETGVRLQLQGQTDRFRSPKQVLMKLVHPTRADLDRATELQRVGGEYRGRIWRPPGRLYVQLGDPDGDWRLVGELRPGRAGLEMQARPGP